MTKQDIINRLNTAKDFGGSWAFVKAQGRISHKFGLYEIDEYPFSHFEVVQFSLKGDDIIATTLLFTESLKEAIECYAEMTAN